ncbi:MAG: hypothetical protein JWM91_3034 [Rhodospirillales bacterium]|nr:hypothetical protein [Rhodospirillales bacterium]
MQVVKRRMLTYSPKNKAVEPLTVPERTLPVNPE